MQHYSGSNNHLKDSVGISTARNQAPCSLVFHLRISATTSIVFNNIKVIIENGNKGRKFISNYELERGETGSL